MKPDAIARMISDYCRALEQPPAHALAVPCDVVPDVPQGFDAVIAVDVVERVERRVRLRVVMKVHP